MKADLEVKARDKRRLRADDKLRQAEAKKAKLELEAKTEPTYRLIDKPTDKQTDKKPTVRKTDRKTDQLTDRKTDRKTDRLTDRLTDRRTDRRTDGTDRPEQPTKSAASTSRNLEETVSFLSRTCTHVRKLDVQLAQF